MADDERERIPGLCSRETDAVFSWRWGYERFCHWLEEERRGLEGT